MSIDDQTVPVALGETSIRGIVPILGQSKLVISGLPGLEISRDGSLYLDPCSAELSFRFLKSLDTRLLYIMVEDFEMPPHTRSVLQENADACKIDLRYMPVVDFGAPDLPLENLWKQERSDRAKVLEDGHSIALACAYGSGRSGMMAAAVAAETGVGCKEAVAFVRSHFSEAVGSAKQEAWVAAGGFLD